MKNILNTLTLSIVLIMVASSAGYGYDREHYNDVERIFDRFRDQVHSKADTGATHSSERMESEQNTTADKHTKDPASSVEVQFSDSSKRLIIALPAPPYGSDQGYWAISDAMLLFHRYARAVDLSPSLTRSTTETTRRLLKEIDYREVSDIQYKSKNGTLKKVAVVTDPKTKNQLVVYRLKNKSNRSYTPSVNRFKNLTIFIPGSIPGNSTGHIAVFNPTTNSSDSQEADQNRKSQSVETNRETRRQ